MMSYMTMIYIDDDGDARQTGVGAAMETNAETWAAFNRHRAAEVQKGTARFLLDYYNAKGDLADTRPLREMVFAMWPTLRASDGEKGGPNQSFGAGGQPLPFAVSTAARSSNAPMENGVGSLHPEFAGWELGYPPEYLACAPSETRSTRARRQRS